MYSIGPLVLIAIASFFFGPEGVQGEVHKTLAGMMGPDGAAAVDTMVENSHKTGGGTMATIFGVGIEPDRGAVPLTDQARAQQGMPRKTERPHHRQAPHPGPRPPAKGG